MDGDLTLFDIPAADPRAPVDIHPTALVAKGATLGHGVVVGPYSIVGPKVVLGDNVHIGPHVTVENRTTIGARSVIYQFASIGVVPQDLKFRGEDAVLVIGEENSIRQYVNMSIGSESGGGRTQIGRRCLFMVYTHVAHDCMIGDNVVFANGVALAGHVHVQEHAFVGGLAAVHQFCRLGTRAMIGGGSMVAQDVPPFCMVQGDRAVPVGINTVGVKRAGYSTDALRDLKTMYRLLYNESLTQEDAIARIEAEVPDADYRRTFVEFLRSSERGVCR